MSYELSALVGPYQAAAEAAREAGTSAVELPQGYSLVAITRQVLDHVSSLAAKPFGDTFQNLTPGVEAVARNASRAAPIAYLEAEMFGGTGIQAVVAWLDGKIWMEPASTEFGWPPPDPASRPHWAFNRALSELGVDRGEASDEFDALNLGSLRRTQDWHPTS